MDSPLPVTSIGGDAVIQQGQTSVGDVLNNLPQLRSTMAQQNPGAGVGIAGLSLLDLRGLGTSRTLVLLNGRRHVPADILSNAVSPDVSSIPNDLIERIDIVTGGNSAVYGSDAIAGVVNFVLKDHYDGLQLRGNIGTTQRGFGTNGYISALWGKNFNEARGNITLHGEYANQDRVYGSQIPWFRSVDGFVTNDLDVSGLKGGSDGFPDTVFRRNIRSTTIHRFGLVPITQKAGNPVCGAGLAQSDGAPSTTGGDSFNCLYIFDANGKLQPITGTRVGSGINGSLLGGNGQTGREDKLLSILPELRRVNLNLLSHYEFSDALALFFEAKWNRVNALGSNAGPSFVQGTTSQFDSRERVRLDNPFLSAADRKTIGDAILASGCNTSLVTKCPATGNLKAADIAAINDGSYRFVVARNLIDVGLRDEKFQRDTHRIVAGVRGSFWGDWKYELSANYGKFKEKTITYGYIDKQRFVLAMDAGLNPATGKIECRSKFDPASAIILQRGELTADQKAALQAKLAADIAACVPYNPLGSKDNKEAGAYFTYNAHHQSSLDQLVLSGFVSGNTERFFQLPGGPVGFAAGGEYRKEKALYKQDPYVIGGYTNAVVIPTFDPPKFTVKEAFSEVQLPVLKDVPFIHALSFSGAARVAKYQGGTGTVWAYNGGVEWSPVSILRLRGNYGRSVRAPNVSETGFPLVPNFANGFLDPCAPARINANGARLANCKADLGALLANITDTSYSLPIVSGSNVNVKAEKSDSYTVGFVFTPEDFVPGLTISSDYYHIRVNDVIASLSAQQIVNNCYDQPTLSNVFCAAFKRWRGTSNGALGEVPGQILGNSLIQAPLNFAARVREGMDTQINYRHDFDNGIGLNSTLIYTHSFTISNFQDPTNAKLENRLLSELGDPKDEFRWDVDVSYSDFTFGYRLRYIGSMYNGAYEDFEVMPSGCITADNCPPFNLDAVDILKFPSVMYHDFLLQWEKTRDTGRSYQVYVGIDNLLDKHPPLGSTATGSGSAIYDFRGRTFYTGVRVRY